MVQLWTPHINYHQLWTPIDCEDGSNCLIVSSGWNCRYDAGSSLLDDGQHQYRYQLFLTRKIHELHALSLVFYSHKEFSSVARNRRYGGAFRKFYVKPISRAIITRIPEISRLSLVILQLCFSRSVQWCHGYEAANGLIFPANKYSYRQGKSGVFY